MKKSTVIFILILILGFLSYACYLIMVTPQEPEIPTFKNYVEPAPFITNKAYTKALTVDLGDNRDFNQSDILYGHDVVLVYYDQEGDNNTVDLSQFTSSNFEVLSKLEQQGRTYVDAFEPMFRHIYLLRLTGGGVKKEITSAWAGGIRAIYFGNQSVNVSQKQPGKLTNVTGKIVLSDGSTREIQVVPVETSYLLSSNNTGSNTGAAPPAAS
jgi:hypothetical protein